jgi:hypothetical protein
MQTLMLRSLYKIDKLHFNTALTYGYRESAFHTVRRLAAAVDSIVLIVISVTRTSPWSMPVIMYLIALQIDYCECDYRYLLAPSSLSASFINHRP